MITRRNIAKALGGLTAATPFLKGVKLPPGVPAVGGLGGGLAQSLQNYPTTLSDKIAEPFISRSAAARLLLKQKDIKDALTSCMYENHKTITSIDPDLAIKKSFSDMAKVTFQRQRNVERDLQNHLIDEKDLLHNKIYSIVGDLVHQVMYGKLKL